MSGMTEPEDSGVAERPKPKHPYAPLLILIPAACVAAWIWLGDWRWGATGLLSVVVIGAVGAAIDGRRS